MRTCNTCVRRTVKINGYAAETCFCISCAPKSVNSHSIRLTFEWHSPIYRVQRHTHTRTHTLSHASSQSSCGKKMKTLSKVHFDTHTPTCTHTHSHTHIHTHTAQVSFYDFFLSDRLSPCAVLRLWGPAFRCNDPALADRVPEHGLRVHASHLRRRAPDKYVRLILQQQRDGYILTVHTVVAANKFHICILRTTVEETTTISRVYTVNLHPFHLEPFHCSLTPHQLHTALPPLPHFETIVSFCSLSLIWSFAAAACTKEKVWPCYDEGVADAAELVVDAFYVS